MTILIDNGHGIDTPGKRSPDRVLREYAWNRQIAGRIVSALKDLGHDASLLVPEETDIPLPERCRRVNDLCRAVGKDNVILISIHANAAGNGHQCLDAAGWSAYTSVATPRPMFLPPACTKPPAAISPANTSAPTTPTATPTSKPTSTSSTTPSAPAY